MTTTTCRTSRPESSIGLFWGSAGRLPTSNTTRLYQQNSRAKQSSSTSQLPLLAQSPALAPPPQRDNAAISLLEVLHTLLCSIRSDVNTFVNNMRAMDSPADKTVHFVSHHGLSYYSPAVAAEDQEFFVRERELDADREVALAATAGARERHCAVLDKQFYTFDRRTKSRSRRVSTTFSSGSKNKTSAEANRIERHRRKIEHLLHVLQDEIAKETRREIESLNYSESNGPRSRQSRRQFAMIIKGRYEAADRIMRILEEYRIVIGVPAVDYLLKTIAEGKALMAG